MSQPSLVATKLPDLRPVSELRLSASVGLAFGGHRILVLLAMGFLLAAKVLAQEPSETVVIDKQTLQLMLQRIDQLEAKVDQLESERSSFSGTVSATGTAQPNLALQSASSHLVADAPAEPQAIYLDPERMDVGRTLLSIRGFGDFGVYADNQRGGSAAFGMGELNLFITSNLSDRVKFLSELVFENQSSSAMVSNDFNVDVERALLQYSYDDHMKISMGLDHTAIGYYNTAYHHSAWMQTALDRPFLFSFEDRGGILPLRQVGVSVSGQIPFTNWDLHYVAEVGNGRSSRVSLTTGVEVPVDVNNDLSENFALFLRPQSIPGLQVGFSAYRETLSPNKAERVGENIWDAYAVLDRKGFEWLNEGLVIRHNLFGTSHIYETPGFYTQLSKRIGSYTPYFLYEYVNAPAFDPIFPEVGLRTGPSAGLRYDATESVALKVQYDHTMLRRQQAINGLGLQVGFTF